MHLTFKGGSQWRFVGNWESIRRGGLFIDQNLFKKLDNAPPKPGGLDNSGLPSSCDEEAASKQDTCSSHQDESKSERGEHARRRQSGHKKISHASTEARKCGKDREAEDEGCAKVRVRMVWEMPARGEASLTHYDLPLNFLASCGCAYGASYEPTAALSALAYSGDERASVGPGPGCGRCFRLTLQAPHFPPNSGEPSFTMPDPPPSVVVKIVDKCPSDQFCQASRRRPNKVCSPRAHTEIHRNSTFSPPFFLSTHGCPAAALQIGFQIHFDLALPSPALNQSFFPSDVERFGYEDFGVWIIDYEAVSCEQWAGWSNRSNLGVETSYPGYEDSCCPINPPYVHQSDLSQINQSSTPLIHLQILRQPSPSQSTLASILTTPLLSSLIFFS
ncbi:hypothetical protein VP01_1302g1 [Puccinia sorghi]|uniref:Expansin-like EG45 domain-containing protein n=1 Tax=Puccinia sorghi TaxID=27349 RepID=A0A0L6VPU2_9BASI|nr:hypothetical protein VP01_1302g1 [Puccinia sorghi]